jgi:serine/threonine protein kinase
VAVEVKHAFPQRYGKYELLERIGEGGMAEVFRARLPGAAGFEKILVLKRILPHLAKKPDFVSMFVDEAKLAAKVQHQNVVQVFELGEAEGGELYMAMEFVSGVDLRRLLVNARDRRLKIPVWFVLHVMSEVLNGLAYAHELVDQDGNPLHVVHRDVTPGNIFISWQGEVKLADFGIAKAVGRVSETEAGQVKGNAPFMSPEAIYGRKLDARADVFSAGVVLWASLALRLPFEGASNYETAKRVCEAKRVAPSRYNADVPPELDALALSVLEIDRERRIGSAREFQAKLLEILAKLRPKLLPADVRHVVDVLSGRKPPDAQFTEQAAKPQPPPEKAEPEPKPELVDIELQAPVWSEEIPAAENDTVADLVRDLGEGLVLASPRPMSPPPVIARQVIPATHVPQPEQRYPDFGPGPELHDLPDEPLDLHEERSTTLVSPSMMKNVTVPTAPRIVQGQPGHAVPPFQPPMPPPSTTPPSIMGTKNEESELILRDVPLATVMNYMPEESGPLFETNDLERYFSDPNHYHLRFKDGSVLTATGLDECLRLCERNAVAISLDRIAWLDMPVFAKLAGLDYLAPDTTPLKKVKMVGTIEERSLISLFAQIARNRVSGRLVVMDKGVTRVARREIDIVGGAPVHVFADKPKLQFPHLYVAHDLVKVDMVPELIVQVIRQRQTLEDVAKRTAFTDLAQYRPVVMKDRIAELYTWRYGRYAVDVAHDPRPGPPFAPSMLRVVPDAVQRGYEAQELRQMVEPYLNLKMKRTENFDSLLQELGLKEKQAQAARRLGQRTLLGQLLKKYPNEAHLQLAMAFILIELEALVAA